MTRLRALSRLAPRAWRAVEPAPPPSQRAARRHDAQAAATRSSSEASSSSSSASSDVPTSPSTPSPSPSPPASQGSAAAEARIKSAANQAATPGPSSIPNRPWTGAASPSLQDERGRRSEVVVVDTLEMLRACERAGFSASQAETIVRTTLDAVKRATEPLASKADLDRHVLSQRGDFREFQQDLQARHREASSASKHLSDVVMAECEKLRAELRYTHEKVSSSQKLDLNLERGRIRDDLQQQDNKTAAMELRLDREISNMRTHIEAAKSDVIKYSIGAVMSMGALGMSLMRLLG